jgi:hypothetical protein
VNLFVRFAAVVFVCAGSLAASASALAAEAPVSGAAPCTISTTLRLGSPSGDVRCLEPRLFGVGYALRGPDTVFGTTTERAVRADQRTEKRVVDGVVGPARASEFGLRIPLTGAIPAQGAVAPNVIESRVIGTSVQGRDIVADRMGTPGGRAVLVIGVIHGDEVKGVEVTRLLRTLPTPKGVDLWLVDSMNPDGVAASTRENANDVDLNRNFERGWSYIPRDPSHGQYSGEAPADQPETRALQRFLLDIRPAVVLWFHQDANVITVNGARPEIPTAYGKLVGLGTGDVPCSQRCTGTASTYANSVPGATSFLVELPGSSQVTSSMVRRHANAVLTVSVM